MPVTTHQELTRKGLPKLSHQIFEESATIVDLLKGCAKQKDLQQGIHLHSEILKRDLLTKNCYIASALVNMYAKCGAVAKAAQVFQDIPVRDEVTWNGLIAGYVQRGHGEEALKYFERMQSEGLSPNAVTFTCILKVCGSMGFLENGEQIHNIIERQGLLKKDVQVGTTLIDMYVKCGELAKAAEVLEGLPVRDVVTWNVLITGYVQQGHSQEALRYFEQMLDKEFPPNAVTFICVLKACGIIEAVDKGEQIHAWILRQGLLGKDIILCNALINMYVKCGALVKAAIVLDELPARNVVSWGALIAGYAEQGQADEALNCFEQMKNEGISPTTVIYICILKACGVMRAAEKGNEIYDDVQRQGLLEKDIMLGTAVVDMYVKCGAFTEATALLANLPRDVVLWNTLIWGFAQQGQGEPALEIFKHMQSHGISPSTVTYIGVLKACGSIRMIGMGQQIHEEISKQGLFRKNVSLGNALVDMYAKCGALAKAAGVLEGLPVRNVVTWNALIAGSVLQGQGEETLKFFEQMQQDGVSPDSATFSCILKVCGNIGAADMGEQIHYEISQRGLLGRDVVLGTTLVDMYAKCGELKRAAGLLDMLFARDVVSWNALIAGYAQQGQGEQALNCFERMQSEGVSPDSITLTYVLMACSRSGLLGEAETQFENMNIRYGITPVIEHHSCMVDLFGRSGDLDKAFGVIRRILSSSDLPIWRGLMGYCRGYGDSELGRLAFDNTCEFVKSGGCMEEVLVLQCHSFDANGAC